MSDIKIANRYAKSLMSLAESKNCLNDIKSDISEIKSLCNSNTDFNALLHNPVISPQIKEQIFEKIFKNLNPLTQQFLLKILHNGREEFFRHISDSFLSLYNQKLGIKTATVKSAIPLDSNTIEQIKVWIQKKVNSDNVEIIKEVDASIIGGIIISFENKKLDLSIKSELLKIKQHLN